MSTHIGPCSRADAVPVASPLGIVAGKGKLFLGLSPNASVEQNLHEPVWRSRGSMRS